MISLIRIVSILLIVLNLLVIFIFPSEETRWVRLVSVGVLTILYTLKASKQSVLIAAALLSLIIADVFALFYHLNFAKKAFFILHTFCYLLLFLQINQQIQRPILNAFQKVTIPFALVVGCTLLYALGDTFSNEVKGSGVALLFYLHGFSAIGLLIAAGAYYDSKSNRLSVLFFFAAFGLVFSDITAFPAHYLKVKEFYYLDRTLYVLGLTSLVSFSFLLKKADKEIKAIVGEPSKALTEKTGQVRYHNAESGEN